MSSREYYLAELAYLREQGREFARSQPEAAPYLAEVGSDPDVERLLEGFAFLTGRLRQRLDDEEPHLTKGLLDLFMPTFVRPFPSVSLQQFDYAGGAIPDPVIVPRGTQIASEAEEEGEQCYFSTSAPLELVPLRVYDLQIDRGQSPSISINIEVTDGLSFEEVCAQRARLQFVGDPLIAQCWRLCFLHLCNNLTLHSEEDGREVHIPIASLRAAGFADDELLAHDDKNGFKGFEQLVEYWHFPEKFHAIEFTDLSAFRAMGEAKRARLQINLTHLPAPLPTLNAGDCQFNCVPAINCYEQSAAPISINGFQTRYRIKTEGDRRCYAVKEVSGRLTDGGGDRVFHPMYQRLRGHDANYAFHAMPEKDSHDWSLRLSGAEAASLVDGIDVLSIELLVTDGERASNLHVGQVSSVIGAAAADVTSKNLQRPSRAIDPPQADDAYWRLLGRMSLNYRSITSVDDLRQLIRMYHFAALTDREYERKLSVVLESIHDVEIKPGRRLVYGALVTGIEIKITVDDERMGGDGPVHLFGSVMASMFSHAVTVNAYTRVQVTALRSQEQITWPVFVGRRSIV